MSEKQLFCSFCNKGRNEVSKLIAGSGVYICIECIEICNEIITEEDVDVDLFMEELKDLPKPKEIFDRLCEYVIGQDDAKKTLSIAVYNHYKRVLNEESNRNKRRGRKPQEDEIEIEKSNVLLLGPTGCGKTLLAKTLAKTLNVPFAIADATSLTEAGYVGEDVESIILRLIQSADYDVDLAQRGIIYVDEVDKIAKKSENQSTTRDVSGEGVQQALLKLIEGTTADIPAKGGRRHPQAETMKIDTKNILFICGGAFVGLDKIVERRLGNKVVGFNAIPKESKDPIDSATIMKEALPQDLARFGLIPEFVGRIPVITSVNPMSEEGLLQILREPKNAIIKQYEKLFDLDDIKLEFTEDALREIAKEAIRRKTGARGLRAVIEKIMEDIMFSAPSTKYLSTVIVTKETVLSGAKPDCILLSPETEASEKPKPKKQKRRLETAKEPEVDQVSGSA
tara:strand:- start:3183 stop:4541 length:1359 start_codon:yes stop_codon:yes gene_type:complete